MSLNSISSLDGRYFEEIAPLRDHFSEFAYFRQRVRIELDYLSALSSTGQFFSLTPADKNLFGEIVDNFNVSDASLIQSYERKTRHDVKAIEYYLREKLPKTFTPWLHIGLTSEDVNNIALALALRNSRDALILPTLDTLLKAFAQFARTYSDKPMLARTHGQPAVPTTLGKEIAVYLSRLMICHNEIAAHRFEAKLTGAVGNFNALHFVSPHQDWMGFSEKFIVSLGLHPNLVTTQILPYDNWIRYFDVIRRTNAILLDFAQDMWIYIGNGILSMVAVEGEVGSSTMPQKVNPIYFENAEGNLGLANAMMNHFAQKLPISRLQRDLSDSTLRRSFGSALGHTMLAWINIARGIGRVRADKDSLLAELTSHWEVISEGVQTILRASGKTDAYEAIKKDLHGRIISKKEYLSWIESLDVDDQTRERLRGLSPESYLGLAVQITNKVLEDFERMNTT